MLLNTYVLSAVFLALLGNIGFAQAPSGKCTVNGIVLRIDGKPVPRAWVKLIQREPGALLIPKDQELLDAVLTDKAGAFSLSTDKWKARATHEIIIGGKSAFRPPIKNEVVEKDYVLTRYFNTRGRNVIVVPNDFIPNGHDPRKGFLDPRAYRAP